MAMIDCSAADFEPCCPAHLLELYCTVFKMCFEQINDDDDDNDDFLYTSYLVALRVCLTGFALLQLNL